MTLKPLQFVASTRCGAASRSAASLLAVVAVGALAAGVWKYRQATLAPSAPPPPAIDLDRCDPLVAESIRQAQQQVRESPLDGAAWGHLGMVLLAHQYDAESEVCFELAERRAPGEVRWPYLRGLAVMSADREAAARSFRRATDLRPDLAVAHNRLGELLFEREQYDEAAEQLRTARQLTPQEPRPCVALARLEIARGRIAEALPWARQAASLAPESRQVRELLAALYERTGDAEAAAREIAAAEPLPDVPLPWIDPLAADVLLLRRDPGRHLDVAESLLQQRRAAEAVEVLEAALREGARDPRVHCALGRALVEAGRPEDADRALDRAAALHPDSAEVRFQRGVVCSLSRRFPQAEEHYRAAIRLKPDYALAWYNLGHTLEQLGSGEAALAAFEDAARYRPTHAAAHANAGRILLQLGRTAEARRHLEIAVRYAPADRDAQRLLDEVMRSARDEGGDPAAGASDRPGACAL